MGNYESLIGSLRGEKKTMQIFKKGVSGTYGSRGRSNPDVFLSISIITQIMQVLLNSVIPKYMYLELQPDCAKVMQAYSEVGLIVFHTPTKYEKVYSFRGYASFLRTKSHCVW